MPSFYVTEWQPNHGDNDWAVCKRYGQWRIYQRCRDGWSWHDSEGTLVDAHTAATQYAVMDELCTPGGLTRLKAMQQKAFGACSHG
jgi:hypothetical protein